MIGLHLKWVIGALSILVCLNWKMAGYKKKALKTDYSHLLLCSLHSCMVSALFSVVVCFLFASKCNLQSSVLYQALLSFVLIESLGQLQEKLDGYEIVVLLLFCL